MKKLSIQNVEPTNLIEGNEIELVGMVQNIRVLSWGAFIVIRTPEYLIQTVADSEVKTNIIIKDIKIESNLKIHGIIKSANIKDNALYPRNLEIKLNKIEILSEPSEYPLPIDTTKKDFNVNTDLKFNLRPLSLRHPKQRAIFKISSLIYNEFSNYLTNIGFTRICSPKLVFTGAEGGSNVFEVPYFGKTAYLAQSPQFYKQIMVGVFGKVFETGSVFRAEKHNTSRHMNEYVSLDLEMQLNNYEDIIQVETNLLKYIFDKLKINCANEINLLEIEIPTISEITLLTFSEVHNIVFEKFGKDYRTDLDLAPEEEKLICEYAKKELNTDFVFVTHYPTKKRPFYAMNDPENNDVTLSFDLLYKGLEITTGGQRMNKYDEYLEKMKSFNLDPEKFNSYLQTFKFGMPKHGGLAIGLERLVAQLCNISNVKDCSLFPRDIDRLEP